LRTIELIGATVVATFSKPLLAKSSLQPRFGVGVAPGVEFCAMAASIPSLVRTSPAAADRSIRRLEIVRDCRMCPLMLSFERNCDYSHLRLGNSMLLLIDAQRIIDVNAGMSDS
jgi:hypothetical protein